MNDIWQERTLALAGIFQAARLTQQLAREGRADAPALRASVQSLLAIDAADTAAVYGGAGGLRFGLTLLRERLGGSSDALDFEMARYVVNLLQLERALARHGQMQEAIRRGLQAAQEQMKFFDSGADDEGLHPRLIEKLAELYSQTISTLAPRIIVNGEHGHLANPLIAARVRAALFAGIRSAFLWRQLGGRRWHLLFMRRRIIDAASELLQDVKRET